MSAEHTEALWNFANGDAAEPSDQIIALRQDVVVPNEACIQEKGGLYCFIETFERECGTHFHLEWSFYESIYN